MNVNANISTLMTPEVITVQPESDLLVVKELFDQHAIHHMPVVKEGKLVGMVSKSDLLYFLKGNPTDDFDGALNQVRLKHGKVSRVMTKGLAKLSSNESVLTALKVFKENLFHAIPIVDDEKLVGILSTHDIIENLVEQRQ